ncbi:hypothetical protein [Flavitalea sp.]|nr:hypothetical protein [Flavitalea sp.]
MKIKIHLLTLSALVMILSAVSCNKDSDDQTESGPVKVKYEISTSSTSLTFKDGNPAVAYTNANFNAETITDLPGGGIKWTKEFTIQETKKGNSVVIVGILQFKGITGGVTTRIYINDVKKSETIQGVPQNGDGYPLVNINATYTF